HKQIRTGARREQYPGRSSGIEAANRAFLDVQRSSREEVDAGQAGTEAYNVEATQDDGDARPADDDAVRAGHQNAGLRRLGADGDPLGDRDGAKAAGIKDIDLAGGRGLGDRTRERLAWCRAAAWVGVITDTRDPSASGLGVRRRDRQAQRECKAE